MRTNAKTLFCLLNAVIATNSFAQELSELSLEELMQVKVKVATETEKDIREAPGIITVIDDKEIKASGSKNLLEVLSTVPGITFGQDVQGNISIIMRGIWAQEGRILLLIDGIEMNDRSYGTLQLGNHFPADHIKRIEIIRGPGSAIYGGVAELGVINVITKSGSDLKGIEASTYYSRSEREFANSLTNFMIGDKSDKIEFSLKGMFTESNFSDRKYTDANGASASLGNGNSALTNEYLNGKISYENFYLSFIEDNYSSKNIILWGDLENNPGSGIIRKPVPKEYPTKARQFGYNGKVSEKLHLHTYYQHKIQHPYYQPDTTNEVALGNSWRRSVERRALSVKTLYELNPRNNFQLGVEQSEDVSEVLNRVTHTGAPDTFGNGSRRYKIENTAVFAQYDLTSSIVNLNAGLRYDKPSITDDTLVPRLGLTKVFGKQHVKVLFAKAFRAPLIENISLNKDIDPEITTTSEIEYGLQLAPKSTWTTNLFAVSVKDAILYSFDNVSNTENYTNYDTVNTVGLESELRHVTGIHNIKANFSTYMVDKLVADAYKSELNSNSLLGAPRYKYYLSDTISLSDRLKMTPSLLYLADTHGFKSKNGTFKERRLPDQAIANLFTTYSDFLTRGLTLGMGINNILNSNIYYSQPYERLGDYRAGPYPGRTREYILKLDYRKEF